MTIVLFLLAALSGCTLAEEDFAPARAVAECKTMRRCHRARFDGEHEDMNDCIADLTDDFEEQTLALDEACTYQAEHASLCVNDIQTASCEEAWDIDTLYEECQESYQCR